MSPKSARRRERKPNRSPSAGPTGLEASSRGRASRRLLAVAIGAGVLLIGAGSVLWYGGKRGQSVPPPPPASIPSSGEHASDGSRGPGERGAARVGQANQLLSQGKTEQAIELYREAAALMPQDEDVHYNLGIALARSGKTNEALAAYETALKILPDYAEVHNNVGNLLLRMGRSDEAIQHLRAAIKAVPDYASAHNNLGNALRMTGQLEESMRLFARAVELDTNYWEARFNLATACRQQNQLTQAVAHYQEVLRLKPDFAPARQAITALEQKLGSQAPP